MPMGSVTLRPGVDTQRTLSLNEAGVSVAQLLRYKEQLVQTYGGWSQYVSFTIPSTVRDLHAWQDAAGVKHLGVGATANLDVVTVGSNNDVTPQISTTNFSPDFSITSSGTQVTIVDNNSSGLASIYNTVFFNTPISLGGQILHGAYKIQTIGSSVSYTITAGSVSTATIASSGKLPVFTTSSGSGVVTVSFPSNGYLQVTGLFYPFIAATSVGGLTIQGNYQVQSIIDSTNFTINSPTQATSASTVTMNSSLAQLVYYVTIGPQASGSGFGALGFGGGGFGTGTSFTGATGTPITATDWSLDNWGEVLLACPKDGPIYAWSPDNGFSTAQVITQAPFFNGGIFISMPQQILVAWRSCLSTGAQDNLTVRWSDSNDFTNWTVSNATTAGSFRLPTGSLIVGGLQAASFGVIWTDVDVWTMTYTLNGDAIFSFNRVGSGCGLVGPHAGSTLSGYIFWMSQDNFFMLGGDGVVPIPCSVWDFVFQNINTTYIAKVRCAANSAFNEITWFFPSSTSTGENDSYVKFNILEKEWDYGTMSRTAWVDVSVLGNPIGADPTGTLFQHETGNVTPGVSAPTFQTGWWSITEGNDLAVVDFVIPDFKYGQYSGSQNAVITVTFYAVDYPGDTPRTYGPYTVTSATEYLTPRIRGRLMSMLVQGDGSSYWRLGKIRFRWAVDGRR